MEEATREQQREARRQKVLARSQGGHRAPVVDLATEQEGIAPEGVSAVLDEGYEDPPDGVLGAAAAAQAAEDAGKSASRLAAERRRKKILSKSTERMAKVQGDRVIRSGGAEEAAGGEEVGGGGGESLDDMLEAAEAEFFGQQQGAGGGSAIAEAKPAAPQQAYFKTAKGGAGGGGEGVAAAVAGSGSAGAAQGKPSRQRSGGGAGFKSSRPEGGGASRQSPPPSGSSSGSSRAAGRRPTGNKALDKKPFDMAAIHSLSRAAGTYRPGSSGAGAGGVSSRPARKRLLGGVRFWVGVEGVVKTALLLLAGAGVGGLLLPEARAAVAQAKFEAEHMRDFADSRSRLEEFLSAGGGRNDLGGAGSSTALDVDLEKTTGTVTNEFGDFVEGVDGVATPSGEAKDESLGEEEVQPQSEDGSVSTATSTGKGGEEAEMGEEDVVDVVADGGVISEATALFLSCVDYLVGWAHYLSSVSMPWGTGGDISCVSAIYLALFVRLAVATAFSALRVVLGLPAMPPAAPSSKPGMMMGMVLASVPALGKVFALGNLMKSIFSDTNLVVAGTVLTLALNLALEEGAGPRRLAEGVSGVLSLPFQAPEGVNGDHSKEL